MARGASGRIVIEVSPELKKELYITLAVKNQTLKDWFVETATQYLGGRIELAKSKKKRSSREKP